MGQVGMDDTDLHVNCNGLARTNSVHIYIYTHICIYICIYMCVCVYKRVGYKYEY